MISKDNIEEKIFDYFEGELSVEETKEMEAFIAENPEYQADFDAWEKSTVTAEPMEYKYANELLVKEKALPAGWLKWATGGAFLFLSAVASVGLIGKYQKSDLKVAQLEASQSNENARFTLESKSNEATAISQLRNNSAFVDDAYAEELSNATKPNNRKSNYDFVNAGVAAEVNDVVKANAVGVQNSDVPNLLNGNANNTTHSGGGVYGARNAVQPTAQSAAENADGLIENEGTKADLTSAQRATVISIASNAKVNYNVSIQEGLKKMKFTYKNPNDPKLIFVNLKDPYLNYALANTLEENASFAGSSQLPGIKTEYLFRTEWPSVTNESYTSQILSVDGFIEAINGGLGVIVNTDRIGHGKLNSNAVSVIYSPKFILRGISFEPSVKYTYNQRSISWSQVTENDVKDPRNGVLYGSIPYNPDNIQSQMIHHDLGLGILVNANKFYFGFQADHLNNASYRQPYFDQTIVLPTRLTAMAGTDIFKRKGGKWSLSPSVNYVKFGKYSTLWGNAQIAYNGFFAAGAFATNEEMMYSIGYGNKKVRLAYGLGFTKPSEFSGLEANGVYYESHQISLRVNLQPQQRFKR